MNSYKRLEIEARAFQIMTGRLAPFKDCAVAASQADRQECWHEWREHYSLIIQAMETAMDEMEGL